jgi:tRNA A37 methylthiotransferase MiaB
MKHLLQQKAPMRSFSALSVAQYDVSVQHKTRRVLIKMRRNGEPERFDLNRAS